jgi:hypothetical protein
MEKHIKLSFQSLTELFAYTQKVHGNEKASERIKESDFNCFQNWQTCRAAALTGWPEGLAKVKALSEALLQKVGSGMLKETYAPCETGLFFDVGLVLSGEPEAWLEVSQTEETAKGTKLVTIGLNCTVSCVIEAKVIRQRGAAVLALVQLLEQAGRSVCVKVGIGVDGKGGNKDYSLEASLTLKGFGEALDADKLAFWLVSEDAFRRCFFRVMEASPIWEGLGAKAGLGYGSVKDSWLPEGTDIGLGGLRYGGGDDWTESKTEAWIKGQLQAQGVTIAE